MMALKKAGRFLSIFLVFSVVAATTPLRASAEPYTGELQLPDTNILPDYVQARPYISKNTQVNQLLAGGYAYPTINDFNGSYAGWPATFTPLENNNFISSQTQKNFSASIEDGVLNCTGDDIKLANNSISLTYMAYDTGGDSGGDPLCLPIYPAAQNTTTTLTSGGQSGLGSVIQSYDMLPLPSLGEAEQITSVESLPNDPDNVRVTVTDNYTQDIYAVHFERQGDVWTVYNFVPAWARYPEYGAIVKDGKTYMINWTSNWVGQVPISLNDDYGTTLWGDPSTTSYDDGRMTLDPLYVNTGYPTPRISQLAATSVSASSSVIRPRNSDVISVTRPRCTRGGSDGFLRSTVWVSCETYGLAADGRVGTANYYNQQSSRGWGFGLLGLVLTFVGLSFGVDFGGILFGGGGVTFEAIGFGELLASLGGSVGQNLVLNSASPAAVAAAAAVAATTLQAVATSPTPLGTVERSNGLGVGTWSWNPSSPPAFIPPSASTTDIAVLNPAPTITSVSPDSAIAGANFILTVDGANFVSSSVINFSGAAKTTSFVSATRLTAPISAPDIAAAGAYPITVVNPTPGGGTSNSRTFTATAPPLPLPSCVFSAIPSSIVPPQSSSLSWNCANASSCSMDNGIGSVGVNSSSTVRPSQTTTYTLSCDGTGGSASFQTTVRTTNFNIKEVAP